MALYNPLSGETLFDIASKLYSGDVSLGLSDLIALNPSIDLNDDDYFGTPLNYTSGLSRVKPVIISPPTPTVQKVYLTRDSQSIYDLCTQLFGNVSNIGKLLEKFPNLNNPIPFNSSIDLVEEADPLVKYFSDNRVVVATDPESIVPEILTWDSLLVTFDNSIITWDAA